jgi:hypothetical protein
MTTRWISNLTLDAVRAESLRAHLKHESSGGSIFSPEMSPLKILAALGEEYGEVCRLWTYDNNPDPQELVKELLQLANVALTWVDNLSGAVEGPEYGTR